MAITSPAVKFTYQDYLNTPDDKRYELLEGDLVTIATPGELHQSVSAQLGWRLVQAASENNLGRVYHAPFDVVLSDTDVVQPDLLFVSNRRSHIITPENIQGAPDLVVEILSPSTATRDRTFKRTLLCQAWRERVLDGGRHRKGHNGYTTRCSRIRGCGSLRRRRGVDFADVARLLIEARRYILNNVRKCIRN